MPSASRANGVAAAPTLGRSGPKKWQFINVNEPKNIQDKEVISKVRAHAMRNVRRKQRLELTAQHQKRPKTNAPECDHADTSVTAEHSVQMSPGDGSIHDRADTDGPMMACKMISELEIVNLGHPTCINKAGFSAQCDEDAQWSEYWQRNRKDDMRATKRSSLGTCRTETPKSLVGDGVFDPFNVMPIAGNADYTSHVLNHCKYILPSTFLFGPERYDI